MTTHTVTLPSWVVLFRDRYKVLLSLEPHVKDLRVGEVTHQYKELLKDGQHIMKFTMSKDAGTVEERLEQIQQPVMDWLYEERKFTMTVQKMHTQRNVSDAMVTVLDLIGALTQ